MSKRKKAKIYLCDEEKDFLSAVSAVDEIVRCLGRIKKCENVLARMEIKNAVQNMYKNNVNIGKENENDRI